MTCHVGENIIVCDGQSGGWRVTQAKCPWCCVPSDEPVRCLCVLIFCGYGGMDYLCGACGQEWSSDDDTRLWKTTDAQREENRARVASVHDPKCWQCHDTGDVGMPGFDEPDSHPCNCRGTA
jgi:hypothetical protein